MRHRAQQLCAQLAGDAAVAPNKEIARGRNPATQQPNRFGPELPMVKVKTGKSSITLDIDPLIDW
jgi:hypothetical protein